MRDTERIPIVLAAIEREWRKHPDQRLGQLLVNLLRRHGNVPWDNEGRVLFAVEDAEMLRWLGAETDDEQRYIKDECAKRRVGWREGIQDSEHREPGEEAT